MKNRATVEAEWLAGRQPDSARCWQTSLDLASKWGGNVAKVPDHRLPRRTLASLCLEHHRTTRGHRGDRQDNLSGSGNNSATPDRKGAKMEVILPDAFTSSV
ncbi:MAG: hypothetical protein ABIO86_04060 [Sphingomonas sp.]